MPALIGYWGKNLRNRFGNQAHAFWVGMTPTKLLGKCLKEVFDEKIFQLNWQYVEAALRGERQMFDQPNSVSSAWVDKGGYRIQLNEAFWNISAYWAALTCTASDGLFA
jgi:hypothetical protein